MINNRKHNAYSIAPVEAGDCSQALPEFGRLAAVQRIFGLKKGTTYNLLKDRKIRGCLLRVRGEKTGVRLIDLASVREILTAMSQPDSH